MIRVLIDITYIAFSLSFYLPKKSHFNLLPIATLHSWTWKDLSATWASGRGLNDGKAVPSLCRGCFWPWLGKAIWGQKEVRKILLASEYESWLQRHPVLKCVNTVLEMAGWWWERPNFLLLSLCYRWN